MASAVLQLFSTSLMSWKPAQQQSSGRQQAYELGPSIHIQPGAQSSPRRHARLMQVMSWPADWWLSDLAL